MSLYLLPQSLINKHVYLTFAIIQPTIIFYFKCDIPELRGDIYKVWNERVILHLGWMDIDYVIRKDKPNLITKTSMTTLSVFRRNKPNRLSMMFIKTNISYGIRGFVDEIDKVKPLLKSIDEKFETLDKALASTLIMQFSSTKLTGIKGVRNHIMRIRDISAQLKTFEVTMFKTFFVYTFPQTLQSLQNLLHIRING